MPSHCFQTLSKFPGENMIEFEVTFNENPTSRLRNLQEATSTASDINLCDKSWIRDANLRSAGFVKHSGNTDGIVGIALNGVPIYSGTSELGFDAFFPKSYSGRFSTPKRVETDLCLGSAEYGGYYKYYGFSPCIFETEQASV